MFVVALFCLERIQFMASFAITFSYGNRGSFLPIAKAVQKICQDEYEVHSVLDKVVLDIELSTGEGITAFNQKKTEIQTLIKDVIDSEFNYIDAIFSNGREVPGLNADNLKQEVLFFAKDVYNFFKLPSPYELPKKQPLKYMDEWINVNSIQAAPQEEKTGNYLLGMNLKDIKDDDLDIDI
jgi:ribonucleoside-diphosphate reductase beta chain